MPYAEQFQHLADTTRSPVQGVEADDVDALPQDSREKLSDASHYNNPSEVLPGTVLPGGTAGGDIAAVVLSGDGRVARRQRNRERVVDAYVELLRDGVTTPSATDIAERADLTARTVYRYMRDDPALKSDVAQRILDPFRSFTPINDLEHGSLSDRVDAFVSFRLDLYNRTAPIMGSVRGHIASDPIVVEAIAAGHVMIGEHFASVFARELAELPSEDPQADLIAMHTLLLYESLAYLHDHVAASAVKTVLCRRLHTALTARQGSAFAPSA